MSKVKEICKKISFQARSKDSSLQQRKACTSLSSCLKKRGRPRITRKDTVWRDIELMDTAWDDVCLNAVDRDEWKVWTDRCASHWED